MGMKQHFVEFSSPGTFVAETSLRPIESWDVEAAKKIAEDIVERYDARPYGFQFVTRERGDNDLDSKVTARSGTYYLGGTIQTLAELKAKNDPADKILIQNMEGNKWDKVVTNTNSWRWTQPLRERDVVLDFQMAARKAVKP